MIGKLPESLTVGGESYAINTDFRDVLTILEAFEDPELEDAQKAFLCLYLLYKDFEAIPEEDIQEAYLKAAAFIDFGQSHDGRHARLMDWKQDEHLIFPAVNRVAGFETRSCDYLHWWTFMGYFMEIGEGTFSQVLGLRRKKSKGMKMEKWEQEWWSENRELCVLKPKLSEAEKAEKDNLLKMLGG